MDESNAHQEIVQKLEQSIDKAQDLVSDFDERIITVQTIPWIVSKDLGTTLENSKYIFLRKNSSKQIVFPSWTIDRHELYKGGVNPQWLLLGAIREFKEELYDIIRVDVDNFIDVYPHLIFENNDKKYIQFRLLAKIDPKYVIGLEKNFSQAYERTASKIPEHDACYIASYGQALDLINTKQRTPKKSTHLSMIHHNIANKMWYYYHKI